MGTGLRRRWTCEDRILGEFLAGLVRDTAAVLYSFSAQFGVCRCHAHLMVGVLIGAVPVFS